MATTPAAKKFDKRLEEIVTSTQFTTIQKVEAINRAVDKYIVELNDRAIDKFCKDIQHKVDLSFDIRPAGHLVQPWEDTVRPIINKRAANANN